MDKKVEYVDLNGLQFFADELRRYLNQNILNVPILTELKVRIENLEDRDFYKIVESYDKLPNPGSNSIIYLVPNRGDGSLLEYIWTKSGYEQLGSFSPELRLDEYLKSEDAENKYLKISDSPFEKGEAENSAVLKGGDNEVISEGGVAVGSNNIVGLKGFYYGSINKINDTTIDVYISDSQKRYPNYPTWGGTTILSNLNPYEVLGNNTVVSLVNDVKYDNEFKVIGGEAGRIRLQTVSGNLPFSSIAIEFLLDPEDYSIYCLSKPDAGIADIGQASFVSGYNNKATNGKSTAFGFNNHAYGKFSFVEGRDNIAGYAAHAEGRENVASGEQSHVEGRNTIAPGNCSHTEGRNTVSAGINSHAEGEGTTVGGVTSLSVGAHGRSSHVEGMATTTGEYNEQTGIWSKGDAAHAEGNSTIASGNHAHAEGSGTKASGWQAHAEGHNTIAKGNRAHAEGSGTEALNLAEHAQGSFNKSTESSDKSKATQFSIGIGTSDTDRKNAVEVKQNGDVYITGIGGFTGANCDSSKTVQEVINELINKLNEITTND